ncbi:MAG TPA: hypothetical protein DGG94_20295 [Micromonosporaceae bacterium]|nr:hypothetical protein [Micromonosporaceae bacterium]HCU52106.1 hypothetical protein [Micromonosporaceae bacterium]
MTVLLAFLFIGYFVLAGLDYGVAMTARTKGDLDRLTPFFLGNEVWLVAAVGLLFGAFPLMEGVLLGEQRLPVGVALLGVVIVTATYGLRIFARTSTLDGVARAGGALAALGWGAALGGVAQGGTFRLSVLVMASAIGFAALLALHGWAFLGRRWSVLAATSAAMVAIVFVVGSSIDLLPAGDATRAIVAPVVYVVVPMLIALQAATWWIFRGLPQSLENGSA